MHTYLPLSLRVIGLASLMGWSSWVQAADPVTDAMQAANAPYRLALYKTNSPSQAEALQALTQAQQAWDKFRTQFATQPSAPYDRDPAFATSLATITKVYDQALAEVNANQLSTAHNTLEAVRDILADIRRRNQIVVFSDHMNAYHSQMEILLTESQAMLAQPKGMLHLTAQTGALSYLARRLSTQAPEPLKNSAEFTTLLEAVNQSVARLEAAVLAQDGAAVKDAVSKLKGPYSKLFAKFG